MTYDIRKEALKAKLKVLDLVYKAQTSHIGSNFSAIDIMAPLFEKIDLDKDKFILSKGWAAAALYYFLWRKGRITLKELNSFCKKGSKWIGLCENIHPDIPFAGGSVGMGLPAAVGFALAKWLKGEDGKVYCLVGDGDLNCGMFWESLLIANHHKLDNLRICIDQNKLQAMGNTEEILDVEPLENKLFEFTRNIPNCWFIYHTLKGSGVSFMENNNLYHYKQLSKDEYNQAKKELWAKLKK